MARVDIETDDQAADGRAADSRADGHAREGEPDDWADDPVYEDPPPGRRRRDRIEIDVEREITKRQIIQSVSSIVVVVLYMLFTLLRDRDAGVVVIDPDDQPDDDWAE